MSEVSTAAPRRPTPLADLRTLLRASEELGGGAGTIMQLCLLAGLRPGEALRCRREDVDWRRGEMLLEDGRGKRVVPLSYAAQAVILGATGGVDGRGPIVAGADRDLRASPVLSSSRLQRELAGTCPAVSGIAWDWPSLRAGIGAALGTEGIQPAAIDFFLGRRSASGPPGHYYDPLARNDIIAVANRWARLLLPPVGPAP